MPALLAMPHKPLAASQQRHRPGVGGWAHDLQPKVPTWRGQATEAPKPTHQAHPTVKGGGQFKKVTSQGRARKAIGHYVGVYLCGRRPTWVWVWGGGG